jgi:hypothetical protein
MDRDQAAAGPVHFRSDTGFPAPERCSLSRLPAPSEQTVTPSEHQLTFVRDLRVIADGELAAADAVRAYHADLARLGIKPRLPLSDDLDLTETQHHA